MLHGIKSGVDDLASAQMMWCIPWPQWSSTRLPEWTATALDGASRRDESQEDWFEC